MIKQLEKQYLGDLIGYLAVNQVYLLKFHLDSSTFVFSHFSVKRGHFNVTLETCDDFTQFYVESTNNEFLEMFFNYLKREPYIQEREIDFTNYYTVFRSCTHLFVKDYDAYRYPMRIEDRLRTTEKKSDKSIMLLFLNQYLSEFTEMDTVALIGGLYDIKRGLGVKLLGEADKRVFMLLEMLQNDVKEMPIKEFWELTTTAYRINNVGCVNR